MAVVSRDRISSRINSVKYGRAGDVSSKLDQLRRLRRELSAADALLLEEFLAPILDLRSGSLSPIRKLIIQMIGEIGLKQLELLPEIIPALVEALNDDTPAVARQAIMCCIEIFRCSLAKIFIEGLHSSELNESLKSSWECLLSSRDEIYAMAFKVGSDGRRLPALKFVESVLLLYTHDPNVPLEPPSDQVSEGKVEEFDVSWLRGRHPILSARDLSSEASRSLDLLLDQLRSPSVQSHSYLVIIVLIKILSAVAWKRPAFYGRILPVLLGFDPSSSAIQGIHLAGVHHALKNAFESCLKCTHPGAAPWRDRLVSALKEIKDGKPTEKVAKEISKNDGRADLPGDAQFYGRHEDEKPSISEHGSAGRKRSGVDTSEFTEDDISGKRARSIPDNLEEQENETNRPSSSGPTPSRSDVDSGPVQQLVALFGKLVAHGEKAAASLEILISSISADLLAEVVMANMRNLPLKGPKSEGDDEQPVTMVAHPDMVTHIRHLSLLLTDILSQSRSQTEKEAEIEESHHSIFSELEQTQEEKPQASLEDTNAAYDDLDYATQQGTGSVSESVSPVEIPSAMEITYTAIKREEDDIEDVANEIPGLALPTQDGGVPGISAVLAKDSTDLDDVNQENLINLDTTSVGLVTMPTELAQSFSTDKSEELSPKAAITDTNSMNSSTATSAVLVPQLVLPKISAPVIYLCDEQKDQLQQLAFVRIIDAYKQVAVAGGSQVHFSVLAHSGMEFPSELDPWKLLKAHILSDYVNHEGHELTLRVLYRLFGEAEEDRDFFTSTTATSVYETFLLQVAETLRDSFPASDKSLSRLIGEVPYLPKSIFEMLECLCSPGSSTDDDKEMHGGDRVTQGLSTVWSLILLRPPVRDACLKIALKSAVHHLDEVRMKAIRLVANKLYPISSLSGKIEDFAKEMLLSVICDDQTASAKEADGSRAEPEKDENLSNENQLVSSVIKEISSDSHQLSTSGSTTVAEVQRRMSLYFALCTKRHSLFRQIFNEYKEASKLAKEAVHRQVPLLVRTIGPSRDLLDIISDPPTGSEGLLIEVVHTLTDGIVPSPELISTIKKLYDTKLKDVDILIPILSFLPKDEVLLHFPRLVNAPPDKFQIVLSRVLQGSNNSAPVLTPAEALIAIHGIDPDRDGIPLKKVTDACNACFDQRNIFTQQVLAKVLNQLVEQIPLPLLFMRTVLQAIGAFPSLVEFIMEILSRLVNKQIWKYPKLWVGFVKCALLTKPHSFGVLLQLPTAQLENALNRTPALRAPLADHASQPHLKSSLPRSTLAVLGFVSEPQTSTQTQPSQTHTTQTVETGNSEKETGNSEKETGNSEKEAGNSEKETGNSEKETETDRSKEESSTVSRSEEVKP